MYVDNLCGWGLKHSDGTHNLDGTRKVIADIHEAWDESPELFKGMLKNLHIVGATANAERSMLWELARKVLGKDIPNIPQEVGDCVSWGAKHAIEFVQLYPMYSGERLVWEQQFSPYLWGMGRLAPDCGNNELGRQDGSVGAWQAKAVMEYGTLAMDAKASDGSTLPAYSGSVARQWGNRPGPDQKWVELGKTHLVKQTALCKTTDDVRTALSNHYPVTVASNAGFTMTPQSDGFHHRKGTWGHQMCIIGYDSAVNGHDACFCIMNSWGDVMGTIMDFRTPSLKWPVGTLRIRESDLQDMLDEQDSFAYSAFDGFPAQPLDRSNFNLW